MGLLQVGKIAERVNTGAPGFGSDGKIFGFSIKDIKDMLEIWRDIMQLKNGQNAPAQLPVPPAPGLYERVYSEQPQIPRPAPPVP